MKKYEDLINNIESWAQQHKLINTFHGSFIWNIKTKENLYPIFSVEPTSSYIRNGASEFTLTVSVMDLLFKDLSNSNKIMSDTFLIMQDFYDSFVQENDGFRIISDPQVFPFEASLDTNNDKLTSDLTAGWTASVTFKFRRSPNKCLIPTK